MENTLEETEAGTRELRTEIPFTEWLVEWGREHDARNDLRNAELITSLRGINDAFQEISRTSRTPIQNGDSPLTGPTNETPTTASPSTEPDATQAAIAGVAEFETAAAGRVYVYGPPQKPPRFHGNTWEDPFLFLEEFESYCRRLGTGDRGQVSAVRECLKEEARCWAEIFSTGWETFAAFKASFLEEYWSPEKQAEVRRAIAQDVWKVGVRPMRQHFAEYVRQAQRLTHAIPEGDLVTELMRHFPPHVRSLWLSAPRRQEIRETYEFLKRLETAYKGNVPGRATGPHDLEPTTAL